MAKTELMTVGDVARRLGVSQHRLAYALDTYRIRPAQRAGVLRLYATVQLPAIESAVRRCAERSGLPVRGRDDD